MSRARLTDRANAQLEAIYEYTSDRWGEEQAERYTRDIIQLCGDIADGRVISRPIEPELGVSGNVARKGSHFIYWRRRDDGDVDIVAILHQRMMQALRLRDPPSPDVY
ncbi:MAG: type II toxin-antitoxin system RelE/ParE family toxin [Sphingomonas sp.]